MTTSFHIPLESISGDFVAFPKEEAQHASRVLRHRAGQTVRAVDGAGTAYVVRLTRVEPNAVEGTVLDRMTGEGEPDYHLSMAVGLLKQRARYETFLEKAVELGAGEITPLVTSRTERASMRHDRSESILVAAMKQCGRSRLPRLHDPITLDEYLRRADFDLRLVCHESTPDAPSISHAIDDVRASRISVVVGPEGGLSDDEVTRAVDSGYSIVRLGPRRLRTETAAITAATAIMLILDQPSSS